MIYPDISATKWAKKYGIKTGYTVTCAGCGEKVKMDRPYLSKDYAGLTNHPCPCGDTRARGSSSVAISKEEIAEWDNILGSFV